MKTYFTLNNINDVIEIFEDFLIERGIRIPTSDDEMLDSGGYTKETIYENTARIYGTDYDDLQTSLLELFERMEEQGKVNNVVNSWDAEVEEWEDER